MNPFKLLSPSYLFDPNPGEFHFMVLFLGFFILLTVGSFYLDAWVRKHPHRTSIKHLLPRMGQTLRIFGIIGFAFLWIRYEQLTLLSMRAFFLLYLLILVWYVGNAIYKYRKRLPEVIEMHENRKKHKKYLPKRKKK